MDSPVWPELQNQLVCPNREVARAVVLTEPWEKYMSTQPSTRGHWSCNLRLPRERKSPLFGRQFALGCATSNLGQDITRAGQDRVFWNDESTSLGEHWNSSTDLEDNFAPSVLFIRLTNLCLEGNTLVWLDLYCLRKYENGYKSILLRI